MIFLIGVIVIVVIIYSRGPKRKANTSIESVPNNRTSFSVNASRDEIKQAVLAYSHATGLKLEGADEQTGVIVLGENVSFAKSHNGYWLYVHIHDDSNGYCTVDVAIMSKALQFGFMLTRFRDQASDATQAALIKNGRTIGALQYPR